MAKKAFLKSVDLPNGETIAYREMGEGSKVLLLIHGNYCSSVHMDIIMDNMPEGYKIYAPDLRGYGDSTYNTPISSLKELAGDVKLLADKLGLKEFDVFRLVPGWRSGFTICSRLSGSCKKSSSIRFCRNKRLSSI